MATNKTTNKHQREEHLHRVSALYLTGKTQQQIANQTGVSQVQVSYDLAVIQRRWREDTTINLDAAKQQELDRIDLLESTYWAAWERSQKEKVKTRTRKGTAPARGKGRAAIKETNEASIEKETLIGNPAFLSGVMSCIERRCKLLGLDAPTKLANTDPEGSKAIPIMVIQPGYMDLI